MSLFKLNRSTADLFSMHAFYRMDGTKRLDTPRPDVMTIKLIRKISNMAASALWLLFDGNLRKTAALGL